MTIRSAAFYFLRITFLIFSILFLRDAFFKWDGYSFYMTFWDFLSDFSLVFIIYITVGILSAFSLWLLFAFLYGLTSKFINADYYGSLVFWLVFLPIIYRIKQSYFTNMSVSEWSGFGHRSVYIAGAVLLVLVTLIAAKFINRFLHVINDRITPLVWCFALLLLIAVPFSFFGKEDIKKTYSPVYDGNTIAGKKRPNIILVSWDTLTAEDMGIYGYGRATTPFLSEWAKDAVVFKNTYSSSNWTTPGAMSLMTGQNVWTHQVWYRAFFNPVDDYKDNIARVLLDNGYSVHSFIQNPYAYPRTLGMDRYLALTAEERTSRKYDEGGYDKVGKFFGDRYIAKEWVIRNLLEEHFHFLFPLIKPTTQYLAEDVYEPFLEFASQNQSKDSEQPFFVWLHTMPPHSPYYPPKPFLGAFADPNAPLSDEFLMHRPVRHKGVYAPEQQSGADHLRRRYDEFILYSDKQFEKFISSLAETIDMSNTIIVFTSDHGESFSHGWLAHEGPNLYEPLVHIPFIVKLPEGGEGKAIDMPVGVIDIAPTILSLAGIEVPGWMDGRSLLPLMNGGKLEPLPVFATYLINNRSFGRPITNGTVAVREGDYKLIYYLAEKRALMFDLKSDPNEDHNIYNEETEHAARLQSLLDEKLARANNRIVLSGR